jgi:hypothetical protein
MIRTYLKICDVLLTCARFQTKYITGFLTIINDSYQN